MRPLLSHLPLRALVLRALLSSSLCLGAACSDDSDQPMSMSNPDATLDGGGGGAQGGGDHAAPVGTVPGSDQRNEADAGMVTRPNPSDDEPQSFESDLTRQTGAGAGGRSTFGGVAAGGLGVTTDNAAGAPVAAPAAGGGEAARAIVEADIIQVAGNTLYALSQYGGLSVIDISDYENLRLLGRYRELSGTPFEMYLRDSIAIVMFSSWGEYKKQSDGSYKWIQTSKIVALDTADPAAIRSVGSFDIAGAVSDSRLVGDVMYVVGYQDGYCWDCKQNAPQTVVLSLNIADPRGIERVDSLELASSNDTYGGGKRSISVNTQRIYIAGPEYGQQMPTGSTIQVVDISDAGGDLVAGTTVKVAGQINNRWQIDEFEGVLRVVSQPFPWWRNGTTQRPDTVVQTYTVSSAQQITALGRTVLNVPPNDTLRSARFDGPRGYVITAEQVDPLVTLDLSDPAQPRQVGELHMPGFVYHMEPRGDRVIGLGYDQNNQAGGITVSIFDVTNLASPRMLQRVNFGGTWASLPEDQDRIHKAFKILEEQGLITVPFSGWSDTRRGDIYCSGQYKSGIQLIDLQGDTLTLRGMAPSRGQARRAIVHGTSMLAVSDEAVDAFDITNRQSPQPAGRLTIAQNVNHALPLANGHVARIVQDWYGAQRSSIDIVSLADADRPDRAVGALDLSKLLAPGDACSGNAYIEQVFVAGNEIDLLTTRWSYSSSSYTTTQGLVVIDATDPAAPKLVSTLENPVTTNNSGRSGDSPWYAFSGYYSYGFTGPQVSAVRADAALVKLEQRWLYNNLGGSSTMEIRLNVYDLSDPSKPTQKFLPVPAADGYAGLVRDGADVLFSHFEQSQDGTRARFYIDRVDLSDPDNPRITDKINVPGTLLHLDRPHGRAVTSELTRSVVEDLTSKECYERFGHAEWQQDGTAAGVYVPPYSETAKGSCTGYREHLHMVRFVTGGAVLDSSYHLADDERISSSSLGDGRVTAVLNHGFVYYGGPWGIVDCFGIVCGRGGIYVGGVSKPAQILVLGGLADGLFEAGRLTVEESGAQGWWGFWGSPPVYATGSRALVRSSSDAAIIDTSVASAPKILRRVPLYGSAGDLQASGNLVLLALGMNGVQRIDL